MQRGLYIVFEGGDGSGKTSAMRLVADHAAQKWDQLRHIKKIVQPGSTPLGTHLRQLIKYPHQIDPAIEIDSLSLQCLYMVDAISCIETVVKPSLSSGLTVFSDRSTSISSVVYGIADGVNPNQIDKVSQLVTPPLADRVYVFRCPWQVAYTRVHSNRLDDGDHFDGKPTEFFEKIQFGYDNLKTASENVKTMITRAVLPQNIVYIDADQQLDMVVKHVLDDLDSLISEHYGVS